MGHYAGLDVSLKEISICVMDGEGAVTHRSTVATDPNAVAQHFAENAIAPDRIVHESGQLSIWLQRGLAGIGLPAVCIDACLAHKALSAKLNKSDRADAEGLAHLARMGWYTEVHVRTEEADRLRTLTSARERLIRPRKDLEGAGRLIRTSLWKDSAAAPYAARRPRHSARATARLALKMLRRERLRS